MSDMKKLVMVGLVTLALCGCATGNGIERSDNAVETAKSTASDRFLCNDSEYKFETVVDSRTGVTYLIWKSSGMSFDSRVAGITPLLNRDGTPVISGEVDE